MRFSSRTALSMLIAVVWLGRTAWAGAQPAIFNVKDFGAVGDGKQLETPAINRAVDACATSGGGMVYIPPGQFLIGTIILKSHVTLDLDAGATLLASQDPADYPSVDDVWTPGHQIIAPLIYAQDVENIGVTGRGLIDGQGQVWWTRLRLTQGGGARGAPSPQDQAEAQKISRGRPQMIRLVRCKDVVIEHINLKNSPEWNVHPLLCENVRMDGLTIQSRVPSPNTDGINPESCRNVQILNCRIDTGDDCVTLKSGMDLAGRQMSKPDENITIANCVMMRGHGGVSIGSEMSGGVRNVVIANCVFQGTDNGIRVKSQRGRGGVVEGISVSNIVMQDVQHPFIITMFYMGADKPGDVFPVIDGTPRFRDFLFSNITARGAKDAGSITGLREMPVENITFSNVHIQSGTGFTCIDGKGIAFADVTIDPDRGPALILRDSTQIDTTRLSTRNPHSGIGLVQTEGPPATRP